jgi:hypothetical protein
VSTIARNQSLERRLKGLLVLEVVQIAIAVAALIALGTRAVVLSTDSASKTFAEAILVAALVHLAFAVRTRCGVAAVRRELLTAEPEGTAPRWRHPYRSDAQRWN